MPIYIPLLNYEMWYLCMGGIIPGLDCYDILYIMFGVSLLLLVLLVWFVRRKLRAYHIKKAEVAARIVEEKLGEPVQLPSKIAIQPKKVVSFDGYDYYRTDTWLLAYRAKGNLQDDGKGNLDKSEDQRTQMDKEDDAWHFVAAVVIIGWMISDGLSEDSDEITAVRTFEADYMDINGLSVMPFVAPENFVSMEIDDSQMADILAAEQVAEDEADEDTDAVDSFVGASVFSRRDDDDLDDGLSNDETLFEQQDDDLDFF